MGRKPSIDRDAVLDVAEAIVRDSGAAGLTIDAVARAAGISKGGVQSAFGTKDGLIDALFTRWEASYQALFAPPPGATPAQRVRAHARATHGADALSQAKAAGLMAALIQAPEHLATVRDWYARLADGVDTQTDAGRRAWLALLATEGAFLLRHFGLMAMSDAQWDASFALIDQVLTPQEVV